MPTIASPRRIEKLEARRGRAPGGPSIKLRMRVASRRAALTEQLAGGADPTSSPELALRASQLTSDHGRRRMDHALRRTISEAHDPSVTRAFVSIINRGAVFESCDAIEATIARLASPAPVTAKGMAMLEQMMSDGISSPLYNGSKPGTLRRQLFVATTELDPTPFDLPIAA